MRKKTRISATALAEIEGLETVRELRRTAPATLVWVMEQTSRCVGQVLRHLDQVKDDRAVDEIA